jgi:transcriptional regulator GlxA family with amidase domain
MSARKLQLVKDYIHAGLATRLTLEDLASGVHMSAYHFARTFKATTGQTPHAYVMRLRIERAQELLRTSPSSRIRDYAKRGVRQQESFCGEVSPIDRYIASSVSKRNTQ